MTGRVLRRLRRRRATAPAGPAPGDGFREVVLAEARRRAGAAPVRAAVLYRRQPPGWTRRLVDRGAVLVLLDADLPAEERHVRLTAAGPLDLVVDAVARPDGRVARFVDTFYHLRAGGVYVVRRGASGPRSRRLLDLIERAVASRDSREEAPPGRRRRSQQERELGRAIQSVGVDRGHLLVVDGPGDALPKLREREMDAVVPLRPGMPARTLRVIEPETFASRCVFHEVGSRPGPPPPTEYDAPAVPLREYRDPLVAPGQVVCVDGVLVPDTFRHHLQPRLHNRHLVHQAARFARLPDGTPDPGRLPGTYFHLDNEERGHYGHLMTEQLSRLWAWPDCKAADPDLKVLLGTSWRGGVQPYEHVIYEAAGVAADDIVVVDGPVRVERLLVPAPLLSNPSFVHPRIRDTWRLVGDRLAAQAVDGPRPARLFCSRRLAKRSCRNAAEVEQIFRERGFEIVYPEDHPIPDQVAMFRAAQVVAGFAGSGLFNLCFVDEPVHVVTLRSESYVSHNEYLMASVLGHSIDSIVSVPEDPTDFQSPFTVDLEREGAELARILDRLPGGPVRQNDRT